MDYNYLSNEGTFSTIFLDTKIMAKDNNTQIFRFMKMSSYELRYGRRGKFNRTSWIRIDEDNGRDIVESIFDKYDLGIDVYFMQDYKLIPWALIIFT